MKLPRFTLRELLWPNPLHLITRAADWIEQEREKRELIRRDARWFDKATLLEAIRFTNETRLGEPPALEEVNASSDERFPVAAETLHKKVPGVDWETHYRCYLFVRDQGYRVAVPPHVYENLPVDTFNLPF